MTPEPSIPDIESLLFRSGVRIRPGLLDACIALFRGGYRREIHRETKLSLPTISKLVRLLNQHLALGYDLSTGVHGYKEGDKPGSAGGVYLFKAERALIKRAAEKDGMKISPWMSRVLVRVAAAQLKEPAPARPAMLPPTKLSPSDWEKIHLYVTDSTARKQVNPSLPPSIPVRSKSPPERKPEIKTEQKRTFAAIPEEKRPEIKSFPRPAPAPQPRPAGIVVPRDLGDDSPRAPRPDRRPITRDDLLRRRAALMRES